MSKNKLAGIIVGCTVVIVVAIVLFIVKPWEQIPGVDIYTLVTNISPSGAGSVSPSGGEYESGYQIILTASPATGFTFDHWEGSASGTTPTVIITMDSEPISEAQIGVGEPKADDIDKMHAYRDAIRIGINADQFIRQAYILYPGEALRLYDDRRLGAIPLRPLMPTDRLENLIGDILSYA